MGKIYYLMGKSSSGKDTLYREISRRLPMLRTVVPYTTRPIREGECEGVEYHFVGEEALKDWKSSGKVIELREYNTVHGIWTYFTADDGQIDLKKQDYLMIGTLESYAKMREYYGTEALVPLYIEVEDGLRLERALKRERAQENPKYKELCRRFLADSEDFCEENLKTLGIETRYTNIDMEECLHEIIEVIENGTV